MVRSSGKLPGKSDGNRVPRAPAKPPHDEVEPVHQLNVLVIDDDSVDRMTIARALGLSKLKPKFSEAGDIASGLDLIKHQPFDVVLLDHILPDGKSPDFLRRLRDANLRLPVVITTGFGDEMLVADLLKSGASDYLPKDRISADSLTRAISHAVRVHKAEEELQKRDILLSASAEAATLLQSNDDRLSVITGALAVLGRAITVDRLTVYELQALGAKKEPAFSHRFEWERQPDETKFNDPYLQNIGFDGLGILRWHAVLVAGHSIGGPIPSFPPDERKAFEARGIRSLLMVPVMMGDRCWGFIQIEDRRAERTWSDREKSILTGLATGIGSRMMRRRTDEALRQNEERYRSIVEDQTDPVSRVLPDGTVTFVNAAYCRALGHPREEIVGRNVFQVHPEYLHELIRRQLAPLTPQSPTNTQVFRYIAPDGKILWFEWIVRGIFNSRGQLTEYQGVGRDITTQKQAESALRDSESRYRALIENIPVISYAALLDKSSTTQYISPQVQSVTGFTPADYRANPNLWMERLHPDDRERVLAELHRCVEARVPFMCEYRMIAKDGQTIWFLDQATYVMGPENQPSLLQGVMYNISDHRRAEAALRESEEKYRTLIENVNIGIFRNTGRPNGRFIQTNMAHARILGYESVEDLMGVRIEDLYENPAERKPILDELKNWGFIRNREVRLKKKDGSMIWAALSARATLDKDGNIQYVDGVVEDITDRKRTEQALSESKDYLHKILNTIADPVFVKDHEHRFVLNNDAYCALTGRPREQILGKTDRDFFPTEQVEVFWKYDRDVLESGVETVNEETLTDARGAVRTIVTKKTRYIDPTGRRFIVGVVRDITDRKRMEDALRESGEKYRLLVEDLPLGVFRKDPNDRFIQANRAFAQMFGYDSADHALTIEIEQLCEDDTQRRLLTDKILQRDELTNEEVKARKRDGTVFWVSLSARVKRGSDGELLWVDGLVEDINERKRAEDALRESEERYRGLTEASPDAVYLCAPDGRVLYTNAVACRMMRRTPETVAGAAQEQLFDADAAQRHIETIRRVSHTGELYTTETPEKLKDSEIWVDTRLVPIRNNQGQVTGVLGISRDISQRKRIEAALRESEENFKAVAENALDGIIVINPDGKIVYANRRISEISGYPMEELLKIGIHELAHPTERDRLLGFTRERLTGGRAPHRYESMGVRKDGRVVPLEVASTRTSWQGKPASLAIMRDITEQKQIEEVRRQLASTLMEIQEEERKKISAMLHDHLGQLLTLTRLELGSVHAGDEVSRKSVSNALQRLDEALRSVRHLAVSLRPPILDDLGIDVALETLTEEFGDNPDIETFFEKKGPTPSLGEAEETSLYRVLQEALTNAAKHSGATRIDVTLQTDDRQVCLEVRDNGKGFDPHSILPQKGIGFIGMQERLRRCGGKLDVQSETGKGTTIRAVLPQGGATGRETS